MLWTYKVCSLNILSNVMFFTKGWFLWSFLFQSLKFLKLEKEWLTNDCKSYCWFNLISSHLFTQCYWNVYAFWLLWLLLICPSYLFVFLFFVLMSHVFCIVVWSIFVYDTVCSFLVVFIFVPVFHLFPDILGVLKQFVVLKMYISLKLMV